LAKRWGDGYLNDAVNGKLYEFMKNLANQQNGPSDVMSQADQGIVINVQIQPRASKTECIGVHGNALKIRISAPPVEGLANEALCGYLAKALRIPKKSVVIFLGYKARHKRILLKGVSSEQVKKTLLQ
jgi:uncharacterized protein (TIGR00251 family)